MVLGIDNNSEAIACFAASVPGARKLCETMPSQRVDWPSGEDVHAHFSPPCTALSRARAGSATEEQVEGGIEHLRWSVQTGLSRFASFSVETVSVPRTRALIEGEVRANPKRLACAVVECADYGVPQTRRRLIAGPPHLIARLKEAPVARRVSVADAFGGRPPAPYLKNTTSRRSEEGGTHCVRSCEEAAFTVCGARSLSWCNAEGKTVRCMPAVDLAVLQTLPRDWVLPKRTRAATLAVGNAVPSRLASSIMRAAAGERPMPAFPVVKRTRDEGEVDVRRLQRRVEALEALVSTLVQPCDGSNLPIVVTSAEAA